ncbi:hypothetical protein [Chitinimonas koreensis]|uniref:hypothetical protein n=1 Tax=Chitinimonas koreensis TaxID=356302 RepID=UPI0004264678|nr:hypothetical protein [Chitinimonas koreensis]QNM94734.1 hypothetical protein H9L41_12360 [Chitinimonas koreensis]
MQLIACDLPATLAARLARQGKAGWCLDAQMPPGWSAPPGGVAPAGPQLWLLGGPPPCPLAAGDLVVELGDASPLPDHPQRIRIAWQDSPFGVEHGFLLAVGGEAGPVAQAGALLDALAPAAGGWLHAGDLAAPRLLADLAAMLGGGIGQLSGLMMAPLGQAPSGWWQGQQDLLRALAERAGRYLDHESDRRPYCAAQPLPPLFMLTPPGAAETDSPACKLAQLLRWLGRQSAGNVPSSGARGTPPAS